MFDIAHENALSDKHLPDIKPDQKIINFELYFDNPEESDYTVVNGELWVNPVRSGRETGTVQFLCDDGFVYIQTRKDPSNSTELVVLLNRIKNCKLPEISFGDISDQISEVEDLVRNIA